MEYLVALLDMLWRMTLILMFNSPLITLHLLLMVARIRVMYLLLLVRLLIPIHLRIQLIPKQTLRTMPRQTLRMMLIKVKYLVSWQIGVRCLLISLMRQTN